ncbi:hypothetical protein Wcon_00238 [Wolbachia endosymbiont of Cylisticus convexus]|nr:hypothetical protein Wcon_00238 [Wolbachia endosymbiont of Cylisticus convexus]
MISARNTTYTPSTSTPASNELTCYGGEKHSFKRRITAPYAIEVIILIMLDEISNLA